MTSGSFLQALIAVSAITYAYYTWRTQIPLVWTQAAAQKEMIALIKSEIDSRPGQKVKIYDLGSGLGGLCLAIAKTFPDAEIVGMELAWPAWIYSVINQIVRGQKNLSFVRRDFWKQDISDGDIVVCYLGDIVMKRLGDKLRHDARPHRLFISNTFPLPPDWQPIQQIPIAASLSKNLLVYRQT